MLCLWIELLQGCFGCEERSPTTILAVFLQALEDNGVEKGSNWSPEKTWMVWMVWLVYCQLLGPILRASAVAKENEPRREGAAWTFQIGDIWDIAVPCCSPFPWRTNLHGTARNRRFKLHSTTSPSASGWACSVAPSGSCWCGQKTNAAGRPGVGAHKMAGPGVLSKTKGSKGN